ncbi:hypothetical protein Cpir12675_006348 [Ceratocystis pirilliformis]|uniref:Chromatin modification-related protein n=1 Tax=Ceratocystis pirilliformis TaxID=259994 RepID=A0ABR3YJE2_9PEZI
MKSARPPTSTTTTPTVAVTPKPAIASCSSTTQSRRSQPVRQARMNPPRSQRGMANSTPTGRDGDSDPSDQSINIFPAVNYLADSLSTLPKELIRHFTLLREVDAKIYAPEETLFKLTDACYTAPMPQCKSFPPGIPERTQGIVAGGEALHNLEPTPIPNTLGGAPDDPDYRASLYASQNLERRQLFANTAAQIKEMLVALEEKNHVISTANDALQKQLARMDNAWPHLEGEFCDEAKWGNVNHWAYPENRTKEGRRKDHASATTLAAAEEAAARSDARKQAVQAKKDKKQQQQQQQQEADFEEGKKSKARRALDSSASNALTTTSVGLGISSGSAANGTSTTKRRKAEKTPTSNGAITTEKTMPTTSNVSKQTKPPASLAINGLDGTRKRKATSSATAQPKKSRNGVGASASSISSPVLGALPDPKTTSARNSPQPTSNPRPAAPRGRQNSTTLIPTDNNKITRPTASLKTNATGPLTPEPGTTPANSLVARPEIKKEGDVHEPHASIANGSPRKRDTSLSHVDEAAGRSNTTTPILPSTMPTSTTKSGRVSKPSTPALATFQETSVRLRASRSSDSNSDKNTKRKKGSTPLQAQTVVEEEEKAAAGTASDAAVQEDEDIEDANEPTYCFCNGVSYGAMVACDADDCAREWFHLECVGLKVAPKTNAKWYCNDCKERMKPGSKKTSR